MNRQKIFELVERERERQNVLHPQDKETFAQMFPAIMGEEVGEVHKAWLEYDTKNLKEECVHVMAVCCRFLEMVEFLETKE